MSNVAPAEIGSVISLWRYPVKSMMGEELPTARVFDRGLLGDRVYGLLDSADGKIATAKNPRNWPGLFRFRAALVRSGVLARGLHHARRHGRAASSAVGSGAVARANASTLGGSSREVLSPASPAPRAWTAKSEMLARHRQSRRRDTVTDFDLPAGTTDAQPSICRQPRRAARQAYPARSFHRPTVSSQYRRNPSGGASSPRMPGSIFWSPSAVVRLRITVPTGRA
jgi:hypothetical protein